VKQYILVSPSANSRLHYAPSGKALTLGMKNMVKFAEGEQEINPALKMYSSMIGGTALRLGIKCCTIELRVALSITVHFDASSLSSYFLIAMAIAPDLSGFRCRSIPMNAGCHCVPVCYSRKK
jgi:hypothetical protein